MSSSSSDFDDVDDVVSSLSSLSLSVDDDDKSPSFPSLSPSVKLSGINGLPLSKQFAIVLGEPLLPSPFSFLCQNSPLIHHVIGEQDRAEKSKAFQLTSVM